MTKKLTGDAAKLSKFIQAATGKSAKETDKAVSTIVKKSSGSSSSSKKTTPTPAPKLTYSPGSLETMTAAQAAAAGKTAEYNALVSGIVSGTGGVIKPATSTTTTTPAKTTTPTASIVPGKIVTGTYGTTQYYSDGTTSNDYKNGVPITAATPIQTPAPGALPGIENMSQTDFIKKLQEMGIASSTPVREEPIIKDQVIPEVKSQTYEDFLAESAKYQPTKPEAPKIADMYTEQRKQLGIAALEDEIAGYDAQKAELLAEMDKFRRQESVGQSASFAAGRISAGAQNIQDKVDALERSQNIAINKLNTKNSFLENVIKFTQEDYSKANSNYQFEFNKNLQLQQQFSTQQDKAVDDARATLTTFNNILSNSGMSYDDMSPTMKAQINQQEIQAKMPVGTMELYARSKPKADIVSTQSGTDASGNDFVTFFSRNADGTITQEKMYTGGKSKKGTTESLKKEQANDVAEAVDRFKVDMRTRNWAGANPDEYEMYKNYLSSTYGFAAVAALDKAMADAGISVDYENK